MEQNLQGKFANTLDHASNLGDYNISVLFEEEKNSDINDSEASARESIGGAESHLSINTGKEPERKRDYVGFVRWLFMENSEKKKEKKRRKKRRNKKEKKREKIKRDKSERGKAENDGLLTAGSYFYDREIDQYVRFVAFINFMCKNINLEKPWQVFDVRYFLILCLFKSFLCMK